MLTPNPAFVNELIEVVDASPYPLHLSMRLTDIGFDRATIELKTDQRHLQAYGIVHGGVFATLIDTATFWAVFMRIPEDAGLVNIDLKLNYLKPVDQGRLKAEGRAVRSGKTISYAEARIWSASNDLIAHGASTLMILPGRGIKLKNRKFINSENVVEKY